MQRGRKSRDDQDFDVGKRMIELIRSEDPVFVSWLEMRLGELCIKVHVLDGYTASAYGGALGAIQLRVMVDEADLARARRLLADVSSPRDGSEPADG